MSDAPILSMRIDDDTELRLPEEGDARELFALISANRAYLREWLPWVDSERSVEDTRAFISGALQQFANNEGFQMGIWYKGQLAGVIGYHEIDWGDRKVEIGYWLAESFQGKGLMTKACRALVGYAFDEWKLHRVEIHCATGNKRSCAIPERLGFQWEGVMRDAEWLYDHFVDLVVYSMLEDEWRH